MGQDKATLVFEGRPLLDHVTAALRPFARPLFVLAAPAQQLPPLPPDVTLLTDDAPFEGPLVALSKGLEIATREAPRVFVAATDLLRLRPAVVRRIVTLSGPEDAAIPVIAGVAQPLCAVYSRSAAGVAAELVREGKRSMKALQAALAVRTITEEELLDDPEVRVCDPQLESFLDADTPADLSNDRGRS